MGSEPESVLEFEPDSVPGSEPWTESEPGTESEPETVPDILD